MAHRLIINGSNLGRIEVLTESSGGSNKEERRESRICRKNLIRSKHLELAKLYF